MPVRSIGACSAARGVGVEETNVGESCDEHNDQRATTYLFDVTALIRMSRGYEGRIIMDGKEGSTNIDGKGRRLHLCFIIDGKRRKDHRHRVPADMSSYSSTGCIYRMELPYP